jgi:hypothetical protein
MGKLLTHFGAGAELGPRRLPLPAFLLDHLDGWQSIVELHNPRALELMDEAMLTGNRPQQLRALRCLVRENYGLPLYEMVEASKRKLSEAVRVELGMDASDIHFREPLERWARASNRSRSAAWCGRVARHAFRATSRCCGQPFPAPMSSSRMYSRVLRQAWLWLQWSEM